MEQLFNQQFLISNDFKNNEIPFKILQIGLIGFIYIHNETYRRQNDSYQENNFNSKDIQEEIVELIKQCKTIDALENIYNIYIFQNQYLNKIAINNTNGLFGYAIFFLQAHNLRTENKIIYERNDVKVKEYKDTIFEYLFNKISDIKNEQNACMFIGVNKNHALLLKLHLKKNNKIMRIELFDANNHKDGVKLSQIPLTDIENRVKLRYALNSIIGYISEYNHLTFNKNWIIDQIVFDFHTDNIEQQKKLYTTKEISINYSYHKFSNSMRFRIFINPEYILHHNATITIKKINDNEYSDNNNMTDNILWIIHGSEKIIYKLHIGSNKGNTTSIFKNSVTSRQIIDSLNNYCVYKLINNTSVINIDDLDSKLNSLHNKQTVSFRAISSLLTNKYQLIQSISFEMCVLDHNSDINKSNKQKHKIITCKNDLNISIINESIRQSISSNYSKHHYPPIRISNQDVDAAIATSTFSAQCVESDDVFYNQAAYEQKQQLRSDPSIIIPPNGNYQNIDYPNGKISGYLCGGRLNGPCTIANKNGFSIERANFVDDMRHGPSTTKYYDNDGELKALAEEERISGERIYGKLLMLNEQNKSVLQNSDDKDHDINALTIKHKNNLNMLKPTNNNILM